MSRSLLSQLRLDDATTRQNLFNMIIAAIKRQRTKAGDQFHVDTSRLIFEYKSVEEAVKDAQK